VTRRVRAALGLPVVLLAGCAGAVTDSYAIEHQPAHLETAADGGHPTVVMEASAVERLGIRTAEVTLAPDGALVVPAAAVFVDTEGVWWVYTSPEPHTYLRHQVEVTHQTGDATYLAAGPAPGTQVVTVGVAEVAGVEDEVGH
jgi:hypothetical protein